MNFSVSEKQICVVLLTQLKGVLFVTAATVTPAGDIIKEVADVLGKQDCPSHLPYRPSVGSPLSFYLQSGT